MKNGRHTVWSLRDQGYRCTYQSKVKTFFWIDQEFYRQNREDILQWAELQGCSVPSIEYGWIACPDDATAFMFRILWGGKVYG